MSRFFIGLTVAILVFFLAVSNTHAAVGSFPPCTSPDGNLISSSPEGNQGVAGLGQTFSGTDQVYSAGGDNAAQCFCGDTGAGVQTNWQSTDGMSEAEINSLEQQGWIYIPDGSAWGLGKFPYLILNLDYTCHGGEVNPNTTTNGGGGGGTVLGTSSTACNDQAPGGAPTLLSVVRGLNSAKLTWIEAPDPVSYYLVSYGTEPGKYLYGNPNVGGKGTTSYTVNGLSGNTNYYFVVRAGNGCRPGPFSNELSGRPTGGTVGGVATGFSAGVLGASTEETPTPTPTPTPTLTPTPIPEKTSPPAVAGVQACAKCIWFPILLLQIILMGIVYLVFRKSRKFIQMMIINGVISFAGYLIFLIVNRNCAGVMDWLIVTIPCVYFWLVDFATFAIFDGLVKLFDKNFKTATV